MTPAKPTFEQALAELEKIADAIESGKIGLEESIDRYEEGMKLLALCRETLTRAEQRITQLKPDSIDASSAATKSDPPSKQGG